MKIRIKFSKHGAIRYIGHLDVMRYFQKAMRRAEIDIKYTEGMSPHQIMSFAQPLSVGSESDGEYLDIEVNSTASTAESMSRLNAVMADGICVTEYKQLPEHAQNAMSSIAAADYFVQIRKDYRPDFDLSAALEQLQKKEQLLIVKKSKRGEKELDLKPFIYQLQNVEPMDADACAAFTMQLSAGSEMNIKPGYVLKALYEGAGRELPDYALHITRKELYMSNDEVLVPLGSAGTDII